jgi:hypothetical protein
MLDRRYASQALGADRVIIGDKSAEMQLGERRGTDRELSFDRCDVSSDQDARVEY